MKELELTLTLRNNRLKARREALGFNRRQFCKLTKISETEYGQLESLKQSPFCFRKGRFKQAQSQFDTDQIPWRLIVIKLCSFYKVLPEELFPPVICAVQKSTVVKVLDEIDLQKLIPLKEPLFLSSAQEQDLKSGEEKYIIKEYAHLTMEAISTLSMLEQIILKQRFGLDGNNDMTLEEIGAKYNLSRERIRQLEKKGLEKVQKWFLCLESESTGFKNEKQASNKMKKAE